MAGIENAPIPDSRPPDAGGVTPEDLVGQQTAMAAVTASIVDLMAAIKEAQTAVDAGVSWANFLTALAQLVTLVAPFFGSKASTTGGATTMTGGGTTVNKLMDALQRLLTVPKDQQASTVLSTLLPLLLNVQVMSIAATDVE